MTITAYPAHLSPYPSARLLAARRVSPSDYPKWDGLCLKLGWLGVSINWQRRS